MRSIYSFVVIVSIVVYFSCRCDANKTTFVNTDKSKLNILAVFGHPGKSHFDMFKPLLEELARRGHEVTVISYFPRSESAKAKEPLFTYKDISLLNSKNDVFVNIIDLHKISHTMFTFLTELAMLRVFADQACMGLQIPAIKKLLRSNETFDVILTENFNTDCFLGFSHRFKTPYLSLSSHQIMPWTNEDMANDDNSNYIPTIFSGHTRPMSFVERMKNAMTLQITKILYDYWFRRKDQVFAEEAFGPNFPDLKEIAEQSQALLVNTHFSIHGSRPHVPNVVEVGGLHISSIKINPLPKDIAEFLDNANEGVLYFSLGSMIKASTMPAQKLDAILKVIGSIPRKVIWKWEADELPRKMDNVMTKKWLPQFDVINHPNVKCYLGHGGLLGLSEGIYAGVPMVLIPMFGDQFHNTAALKTRGSAIVLDFNTLDEQSLRHALDEVFNNTSYRENAQRVSRAYRDRPVSPMETAVWWTEYIARGNGKPYLRSERAALSWYQRYLIDVGLVFIILFAALIYILFRLIKLLLSLLRAVKRMLGNAEKRKKVD